jgi:uncharacterized protein
MLRGFELKGSGDLRLKRLAFTRVMGPARFRFIMDKRTMTIAAGRSRLRHFSALAVKVLFWCTVVVMLGGCGPKDRDLFSASKILTYTPMSRDLPYEKASFSSRDGKILTGWMINGDAFAPKLLYFHGNGTNLSATIGYIELFHRLGFSVFVFDYRGYGESSGEVDAEKDLYEDARGALAHLERVGWRPDKMIYYGQSLGASLAIQMALESPPAGLVVESAFTSFPDMARRMSPIFYRLFGWCCKIDSFDNVHKLGKIRSPLLIIHGDEDNLTPLEMARRLFANANEPKALYVMHGGGHCDAVHSGGEGYLEIWRSFLQTVYGLDAPNRDPLGLRGPEMGSMVAVPSED